MLVHLRDTTGWWRLEDEHGKVIGYHLSQGAALGAWVAFTRDEFPTRAHVRDEALGVAA